MAAASGSARQPSEATGWDRDFSAWGPGELLHVGFGGLEMKVPGRRWLPRIMGEWGSTWGAEWLVARGFSGGGQSLRAQRGGCQSGGGACQWGQCGKGGLVKKEVAPCSRWPCVSCKPAEHMCANAHPDLACAASSLHSREGSQPQCIKMCPCGSGSSNYHGVEPLLGLVCVLGGECCVFPAGIPCTGTDIPWLQPQTDPFHAP